MKPTSMSHERISRKRLKKHGQEWLNTERSSAPRIGVDNAIETRMFCKGAYRFETRLLMGAREKENYKKGVTEVRIKKGKGIPVGQVAWETWGATLGAEARGKKGKKGTNGPKKAKVDAAPSR